MSDEMLNYLYNACDVGINTCCGEGFGLCNLEHGSLGKPQIISNLGGLSDIFSNDYSTLINPITEIYVSNLLDFHGGYLEICSTDDYTNGMIKYYDNPPLLENHGNLARKILTKKYNWINILESFSNKYFQFTTNNYIDLGWCQGYMGLKYHIEDAYIEKGLDTRFLNWSPSIAIFSKKYYNEINELNHDKLHDFCFIGSINSCYKRRLWVINFTKKYFTQNSIFINTDDDPKWQLLGSFDYSNKKFGFNPKKMPNNQSKEIQYRKIKENLFYFEKMCQSKFILCPAGDSSWSFRFYEALMCKSIPIVESWHHTYRTLEEANIKYKYILFNDIEKEISYDELINDNIQIFEKYHLLN